MPAAKAIQRIINLEEKGSNDAEPVERVPPANIYEVGEAILI